MLVNASPDLPWQISATRQLQPAADDPLRSSPIRAIVLTGAEIDQIAGLLTLRERQPLAIYAAASILDMLAANPIFDALAADVVDRIAIEPGRSFSPRGCDGLQVTLFAVPGKVPLYAETKKDARDDDMTFGLRLADTATGREPMFCAGLRRRHG